MSEARHSGATEHRHLIGRVHDALTAEGLNMAVEAQTGGARPDLVCTGGHTLFDTESDIWFEVETSTIRKPASIVRHLLNAAAADAKLIYCVAEKPSSPDAHARTIEKILFNPPLRAERSNDRSIYYNSSSPLKTAEGNFVVTKQTTERQRWYRDLSTGTVHYGDSSLRFENPSDLVDLSSDDVPRSLSHDGTQALVSTPDGPEQYESVNTALSEYDRVYAPLLPELFEQSAFDALDTVESLIIGENTLTRRQPPVEETIRR